jgi:spermidine synthase
MWLTHYDAELVGSNDPIRIDEKELEARIAEPAVARDLKQVVMGSATDFLSYFLMGGEGMARFSQGGVLNTDDNLYLEFSAPFSIAAPAVMEANVNALAAHRESLLPYLVPATGDRALEAQRTRWNEQQEAGGIGDPALALYLGGKAGQPEFRRLLDEMDRRYPWYAPGRFLKHEYQEVLALAPRPLQRVGLRLMNEAGGETLVDITAVLVPVSRSRAAVMFVDNRARIVYGQVYLDGYDQGDSVQRLVSDVLMAIHAAYQKEAEAARAERKMLPAAGETLRKIQAVIGSRLRVSVPGSGS